MLLVVLLLGGMLVLLVHPLLTTEPGMEVGAGISHATSQRILQNGLILTIGLIAALSVLDCLIC